jgi:hypothetical protein
MRRTITVPTLDAGDVTLTEPSWCTGTHHQPITAEDGTVLPPRREDIAHVGPSIDITVGTRRGPRRLLELMLWQDPFPTPSNANGSRVYVAVHLLDGDHFDYDVAGLDQLADDMYEVARRVRLVANRLAIENPLGGGR